MDSSLFSKYGKQIQKQKENKKIIIEYIQQQAGITLNESNITISKNTITLHTTSTQKQKLFQHKVREFLQTKGFVVK